MKNYIQTKEITEMFNISRENVYYWIKNGKISRPIKNKTNHYMWEKKHIEEIREMLDNKKLDKKLDENIKYFDLNNRRYLGNKYKLIPLIKRIVRENCNEIESFFDVFSGTGVVAEAFNDYKLITNDLLYSNYVCHYAFFSNESIRKNKLIDIISKWNNIEKIKEDNYMSLNFGNKYYDIKNARKIGYIREEIQRMECILNKRERCILIASLLYAMDKIANTCGHYDAYRKGVEINGQLELRFPNLKDNRWKNNKIFNMDSNELVKNIKADIVYIDPPYNSRQYSDAYHLLENVARWNKPKVFGVAGKMDRSNIKSEYCTKNAPKVFEGLIRNIDARYILVSYNNMGVKGNDRSNAKISDVEILNILKNKGQVMTFEEEYKPFSTGKSRINNHKERIFFCEVSKYNKKVYIKQKTDIISPLNYTGGKYKLLKQIRPKFPVRISNMIDLFCGGCNVGINVECDTIKFIDKQKNLINFLNSLKEHGTDEILDTIDNIIDKFQLSRSDEKGYDYYNCNGSKGLADYNRNKYIKLREAYNSRKEDNFYYNMMFYVLVVYGFNNQIRFNKQGKFNLPVGKRDFNKKMQEKLVKFISKIKKNNYEFICKDFINLNIEKIKDDTFIYADPPYLITNATYNERGGWNEWYEKELIKFLDKVDSRGLKFALSNVIESKGKRNEILIDWVLENREKYKVHYLKHNYANSNYQTLNRDKSSTIEVLITNY